MSEEVPEVPLVFVTSPYLEKKAAVIRQKSILWEGYERASLLTHEQVELIKAIDKKPTQVIQEAIDQNGQTYASLILYLLQNLSRPDTIQYVCLMTDDILSANEDNARYFHEASKQDLFLPFAPFSKLLDSEEEFLSLEASKVLTILACSTPTPGSVDLSPLLNWISKKLSSSDADIINLGIQELESLLRVNTYRSAIWNTQNLVKELVHRLYLNKSSSTPQIQYQIIFCLWLLTFEKDIAASINEKYDVIPLLVEITKSAVKEKVIRVSVATLRNLVEKAPSQNLAAMLVAKLLPFTENLSTRKWSDSDILEDINYIKERLQEDFQSLTTFEQYASEVETGKLEWSPPHKSDTFWKENASKLEEHNYQLLKQLARLLSTSTNPLVLSVAASDIGYYIKYSSKQRKNILQEIGAKQRIMELMTHEDQEVRYQALLAVQKYMHQACNRDFSSMEKHERIVKDLNNEFKKVDRAFATNEMRIFGKNTGRIFRELDVIRRQQIDLATEHVSLESIQDIPPVHHHKLSKAEQSFSSLNFDKKETMLRSMMSKLDNFTQAMETFHKICEADYKGNETLIQSEDEYDDYEESEYISDRNESQFLTIPAAHHPTKSFE